ncbi:MAG: hypothetical protein LBP33_12780 [Candidatus Adiutrix sp.]|jgi:hypothetical protein|nr:hypothetical protein [Candidatus Adiutrix sp.]
MSEAIRDKLKEAQALVKRVADKETARKKTGWFWGMDGLWRYEIME